MTKINVSALFLLHEEKYPVQIARIKTVHQQGYVLHGCIILQGRKDLSQTPMQGL